MKTPLSLTSAIILLAIATAAATGLRLWTPPACRAAPSIRAAPPGEGRLIRSDWDATAASESYGPPRKYFRVTGEGKSALEAAEKRFPAVAQMKG